MCMRPEISDGFQFIILFAYKIKLWDGLWCTGKQQGLEEETRMLLGCYSPVKRFIAPQHLDIKRRFPILVIENFVTRKLADYFIASWIKMDQLVNRQKRLSSSPKVPMFHFFKQADTANKYV